MSAAFGLFQTFNTIRAFTSRMKAGASPGPAPGRTSEVETAFLHLRLDHDTGEMDGAVRQGRYEGCALRGLDLPDLPALLDECRTDRQSVAVPETYLDRLHEDRREPRAPPPGASSGDMSERGGARGAPRSAGSSLRHYLSRAAT